MDRRTFLIGTLSATIGSQAPKASPSLHADPPAFSSHLQNHPKEKLVAVRRVPWLEETHCIEMFSAMTAGPDGLVYAGTCNAVGIGACLISFDPRSGRQQKLADMQQVCGEQGAKTLPQSKIHSQICFDSSRVAWLGTHCYEWNTLDQYKSTPERYTGGHLVTYDTRLRKATDLGVLVPHESIMSLALAERVGKVYCVLHPTGRFVVYDIRTRKVTDNGTPLDYPSRTTIALKDGRGYTFTRNGDVVRYDPHTDRLEVLPVRVPLFPGDTDRTHNNPFDLAVSADEKRIYGIGWTSGLLFEYRPDDGPDGAIRDCGLAFGDETVPGIRNSLNIAIKAGRDGRIYYAGYSENRGKLACYDPATGRRTYLGRMASEGRPIGVPPNSAGTAGAMCSLGDGAIVVADFDQKQTWFNLFHPHRLP